MTGHANLLVVCCFLGACAADDAAQEETPPTTGTTTSITTTASTGSAPASSSSTSNASTSSGGSSTTVTFECPDAVGAEDVQLIFETHCVAYCHSKAGVWPDLDLGDPSYDTIVDVAGGVQIPASGNADLRLIAPGDVDNSYIVRKLRGTHVEAIGDAKIAGLRMPATSAGKDKGAPLPNEDIALIECWVEAGAPE